MRDTRDFKVLQGDRGRILAFFYDSRATNAEPIEGVVALHGADLSGAWPRDAWLRGANLQGANLKEACLFATNLVAANLRGANLEAARLWSANLQATEVTAEQLGQSKSLARATLPDDTKLSEDNWQAEFEEWHKKLEERVEGERNGDGGAESGDDD
jgi:uncharacterized protein YjbI with pentapeptide repeats